MCYSGNPLNTMLLDEETVVVRHNNFFGVPRYWERSRRTFVCSHHPIDQPLSGSWP